MDLIDLGLPSDIESEFQGGRAAGVQSEDTPNDKLRSEASGKFSRNSSTFPLLRQHAKHADEHGKKPTIGCNSSRQHA